MIDDFAAQFDVRFNLIGYLLSSVQFGFIIGTLTFALLTISDRFPPARVFMISAILGGLCNATLLIPNTTVFNLVTARFGTGFFLAGIYPVGMKIASDYYKSGLGKALGYLVGALVLGTSLPHLLNEFSWEGSYTTVILATTILSCIGGLLLYMTVPDGPYRKPMSKLQLGVIREIFGFANFRKAAFGYFGHMWELYAFWGFVPIFLKVYAKHHHINLPIALWSFIIIGVGAISCVIGGHISIFTGSRKVAKFMLSVSGLFCLCSPLLLQLPLYYFLGALCIWGMSVIADSPQFSSIIAATSPQEYRGTALTITNCTGFAISIVSIQLLSFLSYHIDPSYLFIPLVLGPIFGLIATARS